MTYTEPQQAALAHPCRLAVNTLHSALRHQLVGKMSMLLSINTGYE